MNGLVFAGTIFKALGVAVFIGGAAMALLLSSQNTKDDRLRQWLASLWLCASQCGWMEMPSRQASWLLCSIHKIINNYFVEADRSAAFGALFIGVMFFIIPVASLINFAAGGSPLLFLIFLSCALAILILNFTGEVKKLFVANGLLSIYLGFCFFLLAPIYIFHSFNDRILKEVIGHAFLESIPMTFICYIVAYCAMMTLRSLLACFGAEPRQGRLLMAANGFFSALPLAYALTFFAMLTGHFAVGETPYKSWTLLISGMAFGAISLPLTMALVNKALCSPWRLMLALSAAFASAALLSCALYYFGYAKADANAALQKAFNVLLGFSAAGDQVFLGSAFWITRLPFLPVFCFGLAIIAGWLAKVILAFFAKDAAAAMPYLLSGLLCVSAGAAIYGVGLIIHQGVL